MSSRPRNGLRQPDILFGWGKAWPRFEQGSEESYFAQDRPTVEAAHKFAWPFSRLIWRGWRCLLVPFRLTETTGLWLPLPKSHLFLQTICFAGFSSFVWIMTNCGGVSARRAGSIPMRTYKNSTFFPFLARKTMTACCRQAASPDLLLAPCRKT